LRLESAGTATVFLVRIASAIGGNFDND
jgi:hypothetical protein